MEQDFQCVVLIWMARLGMEVRIDILGPSEMIYRPDKPRPCGAKFGLKLKLMYLFTIRQHTKR